VKGIIKALFFLFNPLFFFVYHNDGAFNRGVILNIELYFRTLTVVKICTLQCGILMFSKRVLSNIWGNIFVIYLERKDVEFYPVSTG
jgi:hypothetical protein